MKKKKILIFGASGFIGTYLSDELHRLGYRVTASDISPFGKKYFAKKRIPYIHVDITKTKEFNKLKRTSFDVVIHLAAWQPANVSERNNDLAKYIDTNVIGTLNILEYCQTQTQTLSKLIYATSHRNTQGMWASKKGKPIKESDGESIKYSGEYAMFSISETAAQNAVHFYRNQYGLQGIIFRLPPVYGFGPHTQIFRDGKPIKTGFQIFIENAMACKPLEVWGKANKGRDIIYIKDVISAFVKAIESNTAEGLYNISSGKALTLKQEAQTIAKVFWGNSSKPIIKIRPDKPNHIDSFVYDIRKAKKELGWIPKYSFEDMLLDYIKVNKSQKFGHLIEKRKKLLQEN